MRPTTINKVYLYNSRGKFLKSFKGFKELAEWSEMDAGTLRRAKDRYCFVSCKKHNLNFYVQVSDTFTPPPKIYAPKRRIRATFWTEGETIYKYFKSSLEASKHFGATLQYIHYLARTEKPLKKYQGLEVYFEFLD